MLVESNTTDAGCEYVEWAIRMLEFKIRKSTTSTAVLKAVHLGRYKKQFTGVLGHPAAARLASPKTV
jgi:hypothetical protein